MSGLDTLARVPAREARAEAQAEHLTDQDLLDYQLGVLPPAVEEGLRDHLVGCRHCTDRLLDTAPLFTPEPPGDSGAADLEKLASWRHLQDRIKRHRMSVHGLWLRAAAAIFLALSVGLLVDDLRVRSQRDDLAQRLEKPLINLNTVLIGPGQRSGQPSFDLPNARPFVLRFVVADYRFAEYEVRLSAADGPVILQIPGLIDLDDSVSVLLYSHALPAGELIARLYGLDEAGPQQLEAVRLRNPSRGR